MGVFVSMILSVTEYPNLYLNSIECPIIRWGCVTINSNRSVSFRRDDIRLSNILRKDKRYQNDKIEDKAWYNMLVIIMKRKTNVFMEKKKKKIGKISYKTFLLQGTWSLRAVNYSCIVMKNFSTWLYDIFLVVSWCKVRRGMKPNNAVRVYAITKMHVRAISKSRYLSSLTIKICCSTRIKRLQGLVSLVLSPYIVRRTTIEERVPSR